LILAASYGSATPLPDLLARKRPSPATKNKANILHAR
jgi:hypothetical protein